MDDRDSSSPPCPTTRDDRLRCGERATPPTTPEPLAPSDRLIALDALRGLAVLGILLLNVRSFSMPAMAYMTPDLAPDLLRVTPLDRGVFVAINVLGWGKFMATFAMLFGVGIVLSTRRLDQAGRSPAVLYFRRTSVLAMVGLLHLFLLWYGDILFAYAVVGAIAYTCRNLPTKWLAVLAFGGYLMTIFLTLALTGLTQLGLSSGDVTESDFLGSAATVQAEINAYRGSYLDTLNFRSSTALVNLIFMLIVVGGQILGLMLTGMLLWRSRFFDGAWPIRRYWLLGLPTWLISVGLVLALNLYVSQLGWPAIWVVGLMPAIYGVLVPLQAVGMVALVIPALARWQRSSAVRALAATGRMAFTNYLQQTVLATTFFYGYGLGYFATVSYAEQLGFVAGVWIFQVAFSVVWLSRFRFGPLEWIWRGLTYGELPPLRKSPAAIPSGHD